MISRTNQISYNTRDISSNFVKVVEGDNLLYNIIITTYEDVSVLFYIFTLGN